MPGSKSDYLENKVLDHILGGPDYSRPATVYVALYTVAPGEAGGGTEVTGGSYARVAVTNNGTNWPAAAGGLKVNGAAITFPTATGSWGTVVAFAILDAATSGNILYYGDLVTSKAVTSGDTVRFSASSIRITEDDTTTTTTTTTSTSTTTTTTTTTSTTTTTTTT